MLGLTLEIVILAMSCSGAIIGLYLGATNKKSWWVTSSCLLIVGTLIFSGWKAVMSDNMQRDAAIEQIKAKQELDDALAKADEYLQDLKLMAEQDAKDREELVARLNRDFAETQPQVFKIVTKTGSRPYDKTTEPVRIRLKGSMRDSEWRKYGPFYDGFGKGVEAEIIFNPALPIGELQSIEFSKIAHDENWILESVKVIDLRNNTSFQGPREGVRIIGEKKRGWVDQAVKLSPVSL